MATFVYRTFSAISSKTNHSYAISVISFCYGMYENSADRLCAVLIFVFQFVLNTPKYKGPYHTAEQLSQLHGTLTPVRFSAAALIA